MRESEEKSPREEASPSSGLFQRVIIVCFEMGAPYSKVRWGTRQRARGPWGSFCLALGLGKEVREREFEGMGFHSPCNQWMKCGPVCGCQLQGKWRVASQSSLSISARSKLGDHWSWACERSHPAAVDLPSQVSAPECKASAEEKRASRAVRQEKGNLLKGKERVTGS